MMNDLLDLNAGQNEVSKLSPLSVYTLGTVIGRTIEGLVVRKEFLKGL